MIIRNQISSDGTLRTWKINGAKISMKVEKIKISPDEQAIIRQRELRVQKADARIRRGHHAERNHQGGIPGYAVQQRKSRTEIQKAMEKADDRRETKLR